MQAARNYNNDTHMGAYYTNAELETFLKEFTSGKCAAVSRYFSIGQSVQVRQEPFSRVNFEVFLGVFRDSPKRPFSGVKLQYYSVFCIPIFIIFITTSYLLQYWSVRVLDLWY